MLVAPAAMKRCTVATFACVPGPVLSEVLLAHPLLSAKNDAFQFPTVWVCIGGYYGCDEGINASACAASALDGGEANATVSTVDSDGETIVEGVILEEASAANYPCSCHGINGVLTKQRLLVVLGSKHSVVIGT